MEVKLVQLTGFHFAKLVRGHAQANMLLIFFTLEMFHSPKSFFIDSAAKNISLMSSTLSTVHLSKPLPSKLEQFLNMHRMEVTWLTFHFPRSRLNSLQPINMYERFFTLFSVVNQSSRPAPRNELQPLKSERNDSTRCTYLAQFLKLTRMLLSRFVQPWNISSILSTFSSCQLSGLN